MEGSATLTIDTSSTTMNCATQAMVKMTQSGARRPLVAPSGTSAEPLSVFTVSAIRCRGLSHQ
jgi:hypothetical protein